MADEKLKLLSEEELMNLVRNTMQGARLTGIDEDSLQKIYEWAYKTKLSVLLLELMLDGKIFARVVNDKLLFRVNDDDEIDKWLREVMPKDF